jgi:hypothetical protein
MRERSARFSRARRGILAAAFLALGACGGGGGGIPEVPAPVTTDDPFQEDVLHYVELTVAEGDLPLLVPGSDLYVAATLVFDGVTVESIGLRLRGHASAQGLDGKPGFSVKTNEFVKGRNLHGVKKLSLNNEVQDPSWMHEHAAYDLWRRAGIACHRTAFARVRLNGEFRGVYLVSEAYDSAWLAAHFADASGNLYEGVPFHDVTEPDALELHTNEAANDRSDLEALRDVLLDSPDEDLLSDLAPLLDLDSFFTYWALESLLWDWDGYVAPGSAGPNNFYLYRDPSTGLFTFVPHGADQTFTDATVPVTTAPAAACVLATRLWALPEARLLWAEHVGFVLDGAWDAAALVARVDAAYVLIAGSVAEEVGSGPAAFPPFQTAVHDARDFLERRPELAREALEGFDAP